MSPLTYPITKLARELGSVTPELHTLILMACAGTDGIAHAIPEREQNMARLRLIEAARRADT